VLALDFYLQLRAGTLNLLRCSESIESIGNAILRWNAVELEEAAAEAGLVMVMVSTNGKFRHELQYAEVLSRMPLITVEKIGESEPVPLKASGNLPLAGIRALGMGHVNRGGPRWVETWPSTGGRAQHLETARVRDRSLQMGCPGWHAFTTVDDASFWVGRSAVAAAGAG
jgi:hypothetical protein